MTTQKLSYMQEADAWLTGLFINLEEGGSVEEATRAVKDKLLQSFRNGQRMCPKCNPRKPR